MFKQSIGGQFSDYTDKKHFGLQAKNCFVEIITFHSEKTIHIVEHGEGCVMLCEERFTQHWKLLRDDDGLKESNTRQSWNSVNNVLDQSMLFTSK